MNVLSTGGAELSVEAFRLQNFMPFKDTDWIELKPICLLFGRNSSGKSAVIRALRFLRQSLNNQSLDTPFVYYTEHGVDVGSYKTVVHRQQVTRNMVFSFRCTLEGTLEEVKKRVDTQRVKNRLSPIAAREFAPWVELTLTYGWSNEDTQAQLIEFKIIGPWDVGNNSKKMCILLGAQNLETIAAYGENEWWFWSDILLGHKEEQESAWYEVTVAKTHGFLPVFSVPTLQLNPRTSSVNDLKLADAVLTELCADIHRFLNTIEYLGPIRPQPQRVYAFDPLVRLQWEQLGWSAFLRFLKGDLDQPVIQSIGDSMRKLDLGNQIFPDRENYAGDLAVMAQVKVNSSEDAWINLVDTGYGASQVLPIIVECILAERDVLVIIEQPELHLHPRAQAELADLLIEVATKGDKLIEQRKMKGQPLPTRDELRARRVRFMIETHSEHILLRLRRRIAESNHGRFRPSDTQFLSSDTLVAYFIDPDEKPDQSVVQSISIDARGSMITPRNFRGFFADDLKETAFLAGARLGMTVDWESNEDDSGN